MIRLNVKGYLPCSVIHQNPPVDYLPDYSDYKLVKIPYGVLSRWFFVQKSWKVAFDEVSFSTIMHDYEDLGEDPDTGEKLFREHNYSENWHWWNGDDENGITTYGVHALANPVDNLPYEDYRLCQVCGGNSFGFFVTGGCRKMGHVDSDQITNDPTTTFYWSWDIDESYDFEIVLYVVIPPESSPGLGDKLDVYVKVFAYGQWLKPEGTMAENCKKIKIRIDREVVGCSFNMYYFWNNYGAATLSESETFEIALNPLDTWDY